MAAINDFQRNMDAFLADVYYNIIRLEGEALKKASGNQISISEMHILESINKGGAQGVTNSFIARDVHITPPSVTVAVKKLENKGYVRRFSNEKDGRQVRLALTSQGKRMNAYHYLYHHEMVTQLEREFTPEEQEMLLRMVARLSQFFHAYSEDTETKEEE